MMPVLKTHKLCLLLASVCLTGAIAATPAAYAQTSPEEQPAVEQTQPEGINATLEDLGVPPVAEQQGIEQDQANGANADFPDMSDVTVEQPAPPSDSALQDVTAQQPQLSVGQLPTDVPVDGSQPVPQPDIDAQIQPDDLFYDANQIAPPPTPSQQGSTSPRKVNPVINPASTLIIVNKNHAKDSMQARMVSAERAMKLGRYDSALEIYDELYDKNAKNANVLMGRAVALQKLGRNEEAMFAYQRTLDIDPKNFEARLNMLGVLGQRYPAVALQQLMEMREDYGDKVPLLAQIAVIQAQAGHYKEAMKYLGMASGIEPKNPNHIFNMAVIADRAGDKEQAIELYEKALETDAIYAGGRTLQRASIFERLAVLR